MSLHYSGHSGPGYAKCAHTATGAVAILCLQSSQVHKLAGTTKPDMERYNRVEKKKDDNPIQENEVLPGCVASFPTWTPVA